MTYQIFRTSNWQGAYWYFDILDHLGQEVTTRAYFKTYDAAKLAAECEVYQLTRARVA